MPDTQDPKFIKTQGDQQSTPGSVQISSGTISQIQPNGQNAQPQNLPANAPSPTPIPTPIPTPPQISNPVPAKPVSSENMMSDILSSVPKPGTSGAVTNNQTGNQNPNVNIRSGATAKKSPSFVDTFKKMFGLSKGVPTDNQKNSSKALTQENVESLANIPKVSTSEGETKLKLADVKDIIAPASIEVDFNHIQIGDKYYRTYFASGYPRFVDSNWLSPIINFENALSISTFYYPVDSAEILQKLKRKIGELEATMYTDMESGKVVDPNVKATLTDAHTLQENIAKGEEKFFHYALYITIQGNNLEELNRTGKLVEATLAAIGIVTKPATLQMEQGLLSTMPSANDGLFLTHNMDTSALASTFPFVTSELTMSDGILFGLNKHNKSLIIFDRFQMENANCVVFARSGSGKSYLIKLEALRSLMFGIDIIVIDPEKEYSDLAKALDGDYITFSQDEGAKINPFDIADYEKNEGKDALRSKILMLHSFFNILFGGLNNVEKSILDRALILTYREKGITVDPDTQKTGEPPLMEDLFKVLQGMAENEAHSLASRLERFIRGSAAGIFNKPSNIKFKNRFTVFSVRDLQEDLRPLSMFLMLDFIWSKVRNDSRKRILIVEEAWYMMQNIDSARFMYSIAKRARKYFLGITAISQDVEDFLLNDFGRAVVTNSAIQILMKQSTAAIDRVQHVFSLSEGEKSFLLNCDIGEGLFFAGSSHVAMSVISSQQEHILITTNPQELLEMKMKGIDPLNTGDIASLSVPYDRDSAPIGGASNGTDRQMDILEAKLTQSDLIEEAQRIAKEKLKVRTTLPGISQPESKNPEGNTDKSDTNSTAGSEKENPFIKEPGQILPNTPDFNITDPNSPRFMQPTQSSAVDGRDSTDKLSEIITEPENKNQSSGQIPGIPSKPLNE